MVWVILIWKCIKLNKVVIISHFFTHFHSWISHSWISCEVLAASKGNTYQNKQQDSPFHMLFHMTMNICTMKYVGVICFKTNTSRCCCIKYYYISSTYIFFQIARSWISHHHSSDINRLQTVLSIHIQKDLPPNINIFWDRYTNITI